MMTFAETPVVQSSRLKLVFQEDMNGLASILDLKTGRDYASPASATSGLYMLALGTAFPDCTRLSSPDASQRRFAHRGDTLVLTFIHAGEHPLEVTCEISAKKDEPDEEETAYGGHG